MGIKEYAEFLANKFRFDNGIGVAEPINFKSLLLKLNILTSFRPMSDEAYGMSLKSERGEKFLLINSNNPIGRQHFTIAHELYHIFYEANPQPHICSQTGKSSNERIADLFASSLLMPREGVVSMLPASGAITIASVIKLEQYFQVSRQSILYRLKNLKLITEDQLQSFLQIPVIDSAKEYGFDVSLYACGNAGLFISDYGEKAHILFEAEKISEGHYHELLNAVSDVAES